MKKKYFLGLLLSLLLICPAFAAEDTDQTGNAEEEVSASEGMITESPETESTETETEIEEEEVPLAEGPDTGVHMGFVMAVVAIVLVSMFGTGGVLLTAASGSAISSGSGFLADNEEIAFPSNGSVQGRDDKINR